jgi:SAM-dependent methyltransferase
MSGPRSITGPTSIAINYRSDFYKVEAFKAGLNKLRRYEIEEVGPVAGKDLLHVQCHFGLGTLCWARALAAEIGLESRFVCADLYELPSQLAGTFDVVYTSRGVLGWLPDINRWAQVAAHFVKPGGVFYLTEVHPFAQVFDDDEGCDRASASLSLLHHDGAARLSDPGLLRRPVGEGEPGG